MKKKNLPLDIFKNIPHEKIPSDVLGSYIVLMKTEMFPSRMQMICNIVNVS